MKPTLNPQNPTTSGDFAMTTEPSPPPPRKNAYSPPGHTTRSYDAMRLISDPPLERLFDKARRQGRDVPDLSEAAASTARIATGDIRQIPAGGSPQFVAVNNEGTRLYVTDLHSGLVSMIDISREQVIATIRLSEGLYGVAANPRSPELSVADPGSMTLSLIEVSDEELSFRNSSGFGHAPYGVAVGARGGPVYLALALEDAIMLTDKFAMGQDVFIPNIDFPVGLAVTQDGTRLYASNYFANTVSVIDLESLSVVKEIETEKGPYGMAVSRDGGRLYVAHFPYDAISVIDVPQEKVVERITLGGWPKALALSPDETRLYATTPKGGSVSVIPI
ncbi:MAG TPA: YncE family protein [Nonomuraea sp.]|nr:YncE family protein [Nonomuraea sp.]